MTTTAWADLPNAAHIDRVIASARAHFDHWTESWSTVQGAERGVRSKAWNAAWNAAWTESWSTVQGAERDAAWSKAWTESWHAARDAGRDAVWNAGRDAARGAILALIAYDDCAYMLDSDPGELAILAAFGDPKAILLLYACKVFHSIKEVV